jgi:hypothetical protein
MEPLKFGRWPDVRAMKYFHKEGSQLWKEKFRNIMLGEEDARAQWNKIFKGKVS